MSEPIEPKVCPVCGKKMLLRRTGQVFTVRPPVYGQEWWCGCGQRTPAPDYHEPHPDDVAREQWERLNAE